jgi:hypothetical protein
MASVLIADRRKQGRGRAHGFGEGVADGGGRGQHEHQRSEAHPKTVAARGELACGLLATEAGGCGRAAPAMAVHGGERGRKTDA